MGSKLHAEAPVDPGLCWSELETVLASRLFTRAPSLSRMLSWICTRYLQGEIDSIQEWRIAVEGLGRRPDFDPEKDSIVRVEFHHLRKRLAQYYETEGAAHPTRITLRENGYIPCFVCVAEPRIETPAISAITPERRVAKWPPAWGMVAALTIILTAAAMAAYWRKAPGVNVPAKASLPILTQGEQIRFLAGFTGPSYIDSSGRSWASDSYFSGGETFSRPDRRIYRTLDPAIYEQGRQGEFRYDIPVKPGQYELRLHFAETRYGQSPLQGAEAMRRFNVSLNGKEILGDFDITRDTGVANTATVRVFEKVSPADDGFVHLVFSSRYGPPVLNGLELLPNATGRMLPVRIVAGMHPVYDHQGRFWEPDNYFLGGRQVERFKTVGNTDDQSLFGSARFGHFSYAIPVPQGRTYQVTLGFADTAYEHPGDRLFDIICNGRTLAGDFDIIREAGGKDLVVNKTFKGLKPNGQAKLNLSFEPTRDYANLVFLEVLQEGERF